jgi:hypothetical protein
MLDTLRTEQSDGAIRYALPFPSERVTHLFFQWPQEISAALAEQIISLMRLTTASAPIIGFAEVIGDSEAQSYLGDLRGVLAAGKCRLLTIQTDTDQLVGLCTLRRNLNPNNRHITDLAKGMIHQAFRGGLVLPAAFYEIAMQCEADGVDMVTLDVRAHTPAHKVWERMGFETWGVLPDYARAQGQVHAGHYMRQSVAVLKQRVLEMLLARFNPARSGAVAT